MKTAIVNLTICVWACALLSCRPPGVGSAAPDPLTAASEPVLSESAGSSSASIVRSMAKLRSVTGSALPSSTKCNDGNGNEANCCIFVAGYTDHADGGGGLFCYKPSSPAADDGGTVIKPTSVSGNGRWIRALAGNDYDLRWFGARCDNAHADDAALDAALVAVGAAAGTLLLPAGRTCLLTGQQPISWRRSTMPRAAAG